MPSESGSASRFRAALLSAERRFSALSTSLGSGSASQSGQRRPRCRGSPQPRHSICDQASVNPTSPPPLLSLSLFPTMGLPGHSTPCCREILVRSSHRPPLFGRTWPRAVWWRGRWRSGLCAVRTEVVLARSRIRPDAAPPRCPLESGPTLNATDPEGHKKGWPRPPAARWLGPGPRPRCEAWPDRWPSDAPTRPLPESRTGVRSPNSWDRRATSVPLTRARDGY